MLRYRTFTECLICTGIICILISLYIGPMLGGIYFLIIGSLMFVTGLLGAYLKHQKESEINFKNQEIRLIRRCPSCGALLNQNICPNCGNIT